MIRTVVWVNGTMQNVDPVLLLIWIRKQKLEKEKEIDTEIIPATRLKILNK